MNPNLDACFWAEQINRQRLDDQAAHGWLADQAAVNRPLEGGPAKSVRSAWQTFVRFISQQRSLMPGWTAGTP
jgi:hypothetical protein